MFHNQGSNNTGNDRMHPIEAKVMKATPGVRLDCVWSIWKTIYFYFSVILYVLIIELTDIRHIKLTSEAGNDLIKSPHTEVKDKTCQL